MEKVHDYCEERMWERFSPEYSSFGYKAKIEKLTMVDSNILKLDKSIKQFGAAGKGVRILYGGSMKPENAAELLDQADIEGGLIGGAALKAKSFLELVTIAKRKCNGDSGHKCCCGCH